MIAVLDCGTTTTKCYVVDKQYHLLGENYASWGCNKNVSKELKEEYAASLRSLVLETGEKIGVVVDVVIAFGMISSDLGLLVVPHLQVPASLTDLQDGVVEYPDGSVFGNGIRFFIIRGVRNGMGDKHGSGNLLDCDFMRGEETQAMGVLGTYKTKPCNVITLGTHFKITHIDEEGRITHSMTTMSGQLFDCLVHRTVIEKSIPLDGAIPLDSLDEMILLAKEMQRKFGLTRAFLLPRFMESFTDLSPAQRRLYLEALLAEEDFQAMHDFCNEGSFMAEQVYVIGPKVRTQVLERVLEMEDGLIKVIPIVGKEKNRDISLVGVSEIMRRKECRTK